MVTEPQASRAVAIPFLLVLISAGHSSTTLAGQMMAGGVVSRTVMVCTALVLLPQSSVAVQVRRDDLGAAATVADAVAVGDGDGPARIQGSGHAGIIRAGVSRAFQHHIGRAE